MNPPEELNGSAPPGDGVSEPAAHAIKTKNFIPMSLSTLRETTPSPVSSTLNDNLSALTLAIDEPVSQYAPNHYERTSFYNGISGDGDPCPELVYRSNYLTTPFPRPLNGHSHTVKSLRGVFCTPLNRVWDTVSPEVRDLLKLHEIKWSFLGPARFFTESTLYKEGNLGPVVIWIGVIPGSTSAHTAHEVSQEILALLLKNEVNDVVVEWHEADPPEWL